MSENYGILGGAFDPIHLGHLTIAQSALEQFALDKILFVPTFVPPGAHKVIRTPFEHRCSMINLAIADLERRELSRVEAEIEPPTYTVSMLEKLKQQHKDAAFTLLIGADSLAQIDSWYQPDKIFKLARVAVAGRAGHTHQSVYPFVRLEMPEINISATELRNSIRSGLSVRFLVPDAVIAYIEANRLYCED
ncbi:MAG: nicotinate (nicotinamide) nucleotide adenylyltransferase [bacterium]|nr:nicotinate (nicotinamide) nucleotide adenylyltransferase [bacterium]